MQNILTSKGRFVLFVALIVLAPLSKYPSFALPMANFPSFRLGLYQFIAILFIILCIKPLLRQKSFFVNKQNILVTTALLLFGILIGTSIAWSNYPQRSALLGGSLWLLIILLFSAWWYVKNILSNKQINTVVKITLYAGIIYAVIGLTQFVIGTFVEPSYALLCPGCTADVFGFARINGLSAEPQFFANSLLPFFFIALYSIMQKSSKLGWASFIAVIFTIGLTFSRGAYFALALGYIITIALLMHNKLIAFKKTILITFTIILSFILSFAVLIGGATLKNSSTPNISYETLDSIAEHLTMGVVDLPEKEVVAPAENTQPNQEIFVSPGLIEASNTERTTAASLAIKAWQNSLATVIFGVGIGNLGPFVNNYIDQSAPSTLTVYIYYVLILVELGIVGLMLLALIFVNTVYRLYKNITLLTILAIGLMCAFFAQYLFFGSYINVMYIWLWVGIALGIPTSLVTKAKVKHTIKGTN